MPHVLEPRMSERRRTEAGQIDQVLLRVRRHCERNAGRLTPEELERLADIVLRIAGDDPEYPSRWDLEHHSQQIRSLDDLRDAAGGRARHRAAPSAATGGSMQGLIARLLVAANLVNRSQREVARLYLWGCSTVEIARRLGVPRTTVQSRWRCARSRLQEALGELSPAEWLMLPSASELVSGEQARALFGEEQRRVRYHAPQHCPAGRERCARTGICPFRGIEE